MTEALVLGLRRREGSRSRLFVFCIIQPYFTTHTGMYKISVRVDKMVIHAASPDNYRIHIL